MIIIKDIVYLFSSKFKLFHLPFLHGSLPLVCQGFLIIDDSPSHSDTPHSVGLLWTSDQHRLLPDKTQHSQETDISVPDGIRSRNPSKQAAADRHLRPWPLR